MMSRILIYLITFSLIGLNVGISHAEERHALICNLTRTIDYTGDQSGPVSGEYTFIVEDRETGAVIVSVPGRLCDTVKMNQTTDASFFIRCEGKVGDKDYTKTYSINRYSGRFEVTFEVSSTDRFLTHIGECRKVKKRF